jgi:hypothetical protein
MTDLVVVGEIFFFSHTRTYILWIQPHSHRVILRHLLNTINSFLCSSTNYFKNRLFSNNLIIVRNNEDDE